MPRKPRIDIAGLLYHVMVRGIERREIFKDDNDRENFISRFEKSLEWGNAKCYAWVLMPNHVHILIKTGEKPLSRIMRKLLTGYAVNFNIRNRRAGHLFQNRYKSIIVEEEEYLLDLVRYIHLNPIRAKIVKDLKELERYKWSGYGIIMGTQEKKWQDVEEVLGRFGSSVKKARENYRKFVEDGIKQGKREDLTGGGLIRSMGGMLSVLMNRRTGARELGDDRILGQGEFVENILKKTEQKEETVKGVRKSINFDKLVKNVCSYYEVKPEQIEGKTRLSKVTKARAMISYLATEYLGLSGRQIVEKMGISAGGISQMYYRGENMFKSNDTIKDKILVA